MQINFMLCVLIGFVGSAFGAPSDIHSTSDADISPADPVSAPDADPAADPEVAIKAAEDALKQVKESLRDAISSIIEPGVSAIGLTKAADAASVTIPALAVKPIEISANKKYAEIVGQFIADLIQIPIVLLHAFGEAIAGLTGSKAPMIVYQTTPAPVLIQTPVVVKP